MLGLKLIDSITHDILNAPVSTEEIEMAGKMLKTNKSAGSDSIPAEFYEYDGGILAETLSIFFNRILEKVDYPWTWCEGLQSIVERKIALRPKEL